MGALFFRTMHDTTSSSYKKNTAVHLLYTYRAALMRTLACAEENIAFILNMYCIVPNGGLLEHACVEI